MVVGSRAWLRREIGLGMFRLVYANTVHVQAMLTHTNGHVYYWNCIINGTHSILLWVFYMYAESKTVYTHHL